PLEALLRRDLAHVGPFHGCGWIGASIVANSLNTQARVDQEYRKQSIAGRALLGARYLVSAKFAMISLEAAITLAFQAILDIGAPGCYIIVTEGYDEFKGDEILVFVPECPVIVA